MRVTFEVPSNDDGDGVYDFEAYGIGVQLILIAVDAASDSMTFDIVEVQEFDGEEITWALEAQVTMDGPKSFSLGTLLSDGETKGSLPVLGGHVRITIAGAGSALTPALRGVLVVL